MLKTCIECKRLFGGEGDLCSACKDMKSTPKKEIVNCKSCEILTTDLVEGYCYKCGVNLLDPFKVVKHYLYDNPHKTIKEVSEKTGVSVSEIKKYVKEGKLEIKDAPNLLKKESKNCQSCGKTILHGNLCSFCKKNAAAISKARGQLLNKETNAKRSRTKFHINKNR